MKFKLTLLVSFSLLLATQLTAQVTIGVNEVPLSGALLQLKQNNNTDVNATKGLGMPRVRITNLTPTTKAEFSLSIGGDGSEEWNLDEHIGLLVYNIREDVCLSPFPLLKGMYVWSGTEWQYLGETISPVVKTYTDTRPQVHGMQTYHYRNFGTAGDWMTENLRYLPNDGSLQIVPGTPFNSWDRFYAYPQTTGGSITDPALIPWNPKYGILYTFAAAINDDSQTFLNPGNDPNAPVIQGICPNGWHVPSDYEFSQLEEEMAKNPQKYSSVTTPTPWRDRVNDSQLFVVSGSRDDYEAANLRPDMTNVVGHATAMVSPCNVAGVSTSTGGLSNLTEQGGFNALPVGISEGNKTNFYGVAAYFWTSSTDDNTSSYGNAIERSMGINYHAVYRINGVRTTLFSVRCKKD